MYNPVELFNKEPVAIAAAILGVINALQLFGVIAVSADQMAGLNIALVGVLGLFVRAKVTPVA